MKRRPGGEDENQTGEKEGREREAPREIQDDGGGLAWGTGELNMGGGFI